MSTDDAKINCGRGFDRRRSVVKLAVFSMFVKPLKCRYTKRKRLFHFK